MADYQTDFLGAIKSHIQPIFRTSQITVALLRMRSFNPMYLPDAQAAGGIPMRRLLQTTPCTTDQCMQRYGDCNSYAGAGCLSGKCSYTTCSRTGTKLDCTWSCASQSTISACDPSLFCGNCNSKRGSSCPSGRCVWVGCSIDYAIGSPSCSHECLAPPPPPPSPPPSPVGRPTQSNLRSTHNYSLIYVIMQ
jgi:hypothetical protein